MPAPRIRADYDALARIAEGFSRAAEANRSSVRAIQRAKGTLEREDNPNHIW